MTFCATAWTSALRRVAETELGLSWEETHAAQLMGVWDHFYEDSAFSSEVSTHYVILPHFLRLDRTLNLSDLPLDQHLDWRWQEASSAAVAEDVHPYVRVYAQWVVREGFLSAPNLNDQTNSTAALSKLGLL